MEVSFSPELKSIRNQFVLNFENLDALSETENSDSRKTGPRSAQLVLPGKSKINGATTNRQMTTHPPAARLPYQQVDPWPIKYKLLVP